jgi:hypothetical protein
MSCPGPPPFIPTAAGCVFRPACARTTRAVGAVRGVGGFLAYDSSARCARSYGTHSTPRHHALAHTTGSESHAASLQTAIPLLLMVMVMVMMMMMRMLLMMMVVVVAVVQLLSAGVDDAVVCVPVPCRPWCDRRAWSAAQCLSAFALVCNQRSCAGTFPKNGR